MTGPRDSSRRTVHVNGIDLNVVVAGSGPAVLLVHGFPDSLEVWRKQIPVLAAAGYTVIAPDLRGCGLSDAPAQRSAYRAERLVADLLGLLDTLNVAEVRLVGHDWGAVIGWLFCCAHPERVDRYVALSVGHPGAYVHGSLEQKLKGWYVLFLQFPVVAERLLRARGWWMFRKLVRYPDEAQRWIANLSRPGRLTAAINYYRANLALLLRRDWPPVRVPVMGVWSDGDLFLVESQMLDSRRLVEGPFRYERVGHANHWLQLTAAERVNELLLDYLSSPPTSS
ncbi:MAG: alpha/beta fold hydrolase [Nevskia sp.]|nr:alpha/beta fold hydrolase [Nevskia sp.]